MKKSEVQSARPIIGSMHAASEAPAGIAFGRFLLLPHRRELLADGRPVKLGGRAFDVLMAYESRRLPIFFGIGEASAQICNKLGFAVRRIGDQAIVALDQFPIENLSPELQGIHRALGRLAILLHGSAGLTSGARVAWRILPSESGTSRRLVRITAGP